MQHIEGDITIEGKAMLDTYYQTKDAREQLFDERNEEADKVSARITEILFELSFSFTPDYLLRMHRRLFEGIYKHAGQLRDVNITKKEWVLNGALCYIQTMICCVKHLNTTSNRRRKPITRC